MENEKKNDKRKKRPTMTEEQRAERRRKIAETKEQSRLWLEGRYMKSRYEQFLMSPVWLTESHTRLTELSGKYINKAIELMKEVFDMNHTLFNAQDEQHKLIVEKAEALGFDHPEYNKMSNRKHESLNQLGDLYEKMTIAHYIREALIKHKDAVINTAWDENVLSGRDN